MTKKCPICGQKMDIYTTAHKNQPFVDEKTYPALCFTCYFVPKTEDQKYGKDGTISESLELPYSHRNLHTAKEIYEMGASESLSQANKCVQAVTEACKGVREGKKPKTRPKASWNVC
ncbi:hypothetical protein EBT16_03650 [bacterium]|nr:hypothetical protein [bacterium]